MKIKALITELPKAPDMADPVDFDKDADAFVRALVPFSKDINRFILEANHLSAFLNELSDESKAYADLTLEKLESGTNLSILEIERFCKEFQLLLEEEAKKRLVSFSDACLEAIENKGFEMIERLNDNAKGADYIALSQTLTHNLSLERFLMERGMIKLEKEELNLDDVIAALKTGEKDLKRSSEALGNITQILETQNAINLILQGENNV